MAIVQDVPDNHVIANSTSSSTFHSTARQRNSASSSLPKPQDKTQIKAKKSQSQPPASTPDFKPQIKLIDLTGNLSPQGKVEHILGSEILDGGDEGDDEDPIGGSKGLGEIVDDDADRDDDEDEGVDGTEWDEFFDSMVLTVPFTFLYIMLDILTNLSYSRHPNWDYYAKNFLVAIPTIGIIIFYSNRHITNEYVRLVLLVMSATLGMRLIWLVNKASYLTVMMQAPAVGTLWIITIVQLPLGRALLALLLVAGWCWWARMKIRP